MQLFMTALTVVVGIIIVASFMHNYRVVGLDPEIDPVDR